MVNNHFTMRMHNLLIGLAIAAVIAAAPPASAVIIHRYLLDGNTNDSVGNLHLSAIDDFAPDFVSDNIAGGQAAEFTGINAVLGDVPAGDPLRSSIFSLAFWIKYGGQPGGFGMPIGRADGSNTPWVAQINPDGSFHWIAQAAGTPGVGGLNTGGGDADPWRHVVISQDHDRASLYVDGVSVFQNAPTPIVNVEDNKPLRLGRRADGFLFAGRLDDVQIYNNALGPADVAALYANPGQTVVPTTPPRLELHIDRVSGETTLRNPSTSGPAVELISYTLSSPSNTLESSDARWLSLQDAGEPDWFEANPTAANLSELTSDAPFSLMPGESYRLGTPFTVNTGVPLGTNPVNLAGASFKYQLTDGTVLNAIQREVRVNNLVLVVDPMTGFTTLQNQSFQPVELISYTISSPSGALLTSYAGSQQSDWFPANPTANNLSELSSGDAILLDEGEQLDLGLAWTTAGLRDLTAVFQTLNGDLLNAPVIFGEPLDIAPGVSGDFNRDGIVDAADYTVWRDNLGAATEDALMGNGDGVPGVGQGDYTLWKMNFGMTASAAGALAVDAAPVPEPGAITLLTFAVVGWRTMRWRRPG